MVLGLVVGYLRVVVIPPGAKAFGREVGGDLFDFFLLDEDHLGFVIGDVSGKGVPAALFMAVSRTLLRATAQHHVSPGECLSYVNSSLVEQSIASMFGSSAFGIRRASPISTARPVTPTPTRCV